MLSCMSWDIICSLRASADRWPCGGETGPRQRPCAAQSGARCRESPTSSVSDSSRLDKALFIHALRSNESCANAPKSCRAPAEPAHRVRQRTPPLAHCATRIPAGRADCAVGRTTHRHRLTSKQCLAVGRARNVRAPRCRRCERRDRRCRSGAERLRHAHCRARLTQDYIRQRTALAESRFYRALTVQTAVLTMCFILDISSDGRIECGGPPDATSSQPTARLTAARPCAAGGSGSPLDTS